MILLQVDIENALHVVNHFKNGAVMDSMNMDSLIAVNAVKPLFSMELMKNSEDQEFFYSSQPKNFPMTVQLIFDHLLVEIAKLPSVERSLLQEYFRKNDVPKEVFLKTPLRTS